MRTRSGAASNRSRRPCPGAHHRGRLVAAAPRRHHPSPARGTSRGRRPKGPVAAAATADLDLAQTRCPRYRAPTTRASTERVQVMAAAGAAGRSRRSPRAETETSVGRCHRSRRHCRPDAGRVKPGYAASVYQHLVMPDSLGPIRRTPPTPVRRRTAVVLMGAVEA